ncbi:hypothetical protein V8C35DRAFT_93903 [Trichoderma chlorosporum]
MAALTQTYQQQTGTVTMLQRPTPSGMMPASQSNGHHQYTTSAPRGGGGYRGSTVPVQSYAFTPTPNLNQSLQWQQYGSYRTNSSPSGIPTQTFDPSLVQRAHRANPSVTNMALIPAYNGSHANSQSSGQSSGHSSSHSSSHGSSSARDDPAKSPSRSATPSSRPQLAHVSTAPSALPTTGASRNAPDRYRRPSHSNTQQSRPQISNPPLSPGALNNNQLYNAPSGSRSVPNLAASPSLGPGGSMDDSNLHRGPSPDEAKKMRRRSVHTIQSTDSFRPLLKPENAPRQEQAVKAKSVDRSEKSPQVAQKMAMHVRKGSNDSASSSRSSHSRSASSSNRNPTTPTGNPSSPGGDETSAKNDQLKVANIPPRGSSADGVKRTISPSPLSKPATMANESAGDAAAAPAAAASAKSVVSPAAKQLAAINEKDVKGKTKTSRLRRAFSFGSAAEFRKAGGPDGDGMERVEVAKLRKDPTAEEAYDAEQARIAEAQEAAGIGNSIYGGRFFGGSTDNLSISSTASSASIMIRKMGRGMKKSTRSLVGLFRPKSVVGVPAADGPVSEGQAAVSMITVEAESRRVNVTADPHSGKGTGFPRLERNSLDATQIPEIGAERLGSAGTDNSGPRKSIAGGDKERAEVLAAVRKGILKRSGSSSPSIRPSESPDLMLPNIPAVADSPNSSAPSTPNDDGKRTGSIAIGTEDYFMSALGRLGKSRPGTPQAGPKRNATFSPRIIFYDTWPSQEYDRRGEIATCNRLTPMLAQQIKEELNSFKMEMEVHENSKIYTHFF